MAARVLLKSMILAEALRIDKKRKRIKKERFSLKTLERNGKYPCRICNKTNANTHIFCNGMNINIAHEVESFSKVIISNKDRYSKHICQNCLDLLNSCILFRKTCQQTEKLLTEAHGDTEYKIEESNSDNEADQNNGGLWTEELLSHIQDETQKCTECSKEFGDMEAYNWHLPFCDARHGEEKKPKRKVPNLKKKVDEKTTDLSSSRKSKLTYLCDTCGKTCCNKHVLASHMTTHTNVFPFECDTCPYRGRTLDLLRTHQRTHLAVKPFKCNSCPKTTTTASNLSRHVMTRHSRPEYNVKCMYCDRTFTSKLGLKKHVNNIHLRQAGGYECEICFRKYSTTKALRGHRYKVHDVQPALMGRLPSYLLHQIAQASAEQDAMEGDDATGEE